MGLIYWIVVGLIAGWLAGKVMKGSGYGVLVDIVLGILGGIFGGGLSSAIWDARYLARRRHHWLDHRCVCRCGDSGVDHAAVEKGVTQHRKKLKRVPKAGRAGGANRNCFKKTLVGFASLWVRDQKPLDGRFPLVLQERVQRLLFTTFEPGRLLVGHLRMVRPHAPRRRWTGRRRGLRPIRSEDR